MPYLNLSSNKGVFFDDKDEASVGFVTDLTDEEDEPSEERLGVSASAFQGSWTSRHLHSRVAGSKIA